jgi:recombination protein RecR
MIPQALQDAIEALSHLPGVGVRSAERFACYLLRSPDEISQNISAALATLHQGIKVCPVTFAYIDTDTDVSELYSDPHRDRTSIVVVENPLDIVAIERTGSYKGTYHVLGGVISPLDNITPEKLHIRELINRISADGVTEVIIATNPSIEGESTAIFISNLISETLMEKSPNITRLARGLPLGTSLEYADPNTLGAALKNRTKLQN